MYVLQHGDIGKRIAGYRDYVRPQANLNQAAIVEFEKICRIERRSANGFQRLHALSYHHRKR